MSKTPVRANVTPSRHPILALETATTCGSVALVENGRTLAEYSLDIQTTHSRRIFSQIEKVMDNVGAEWTGLAGVAISLGPGSFTGLRIGLSVAKGLVMSHNLPLLGISTLDGLARQITAPPGTRICALLDARKLEVYAALYECDRDGIPIRKGEDLVLPPEKLALKLEGPVLLIGDGAVVYRDVFMGGPDSDVIITGIGNHFPRAATIGLLAEKKLAENDLLDPINSVPIYVRASEAEINLQKKS